MMPHQELAGLQAVRNRLLEASPSLAGALTLEELAEGTVQQLRRILGVSMAAALLYDEHQPSVFAFDASSNVADILLARTEMTALCTQVHSHRVASRHSVAHAAGVCAIGLRSRDGREVGTLAVSEWGGGGEPEVLQILGHFGHIVAAARDNVSLHHAAHRALQARDDVMAIVSHDLRAPLGNIRIGTSLLRDTADATERPILARIDRAVTHLSRLVDDLVDMVRIDGRSLDVTPSVERIAEIMEIVLAITMPMAEDAHVELRLRASENDETIFADRHRVVQALTNLVGNAIKFTPAGGSVDISYEVRVEDTVFRVRDTGRGIEKAEFDHVFTRYWRAEAKRMRGLGLGLYIAKGVVEAHGGRIWFESQVGLGTTFSFSLPHATAPGTRIPNADRISDNATPKMASTWRIVIADDDEDMRYLIASALRRRGFRVVEAANGQQLLTTFDSEPLVPTLILSDIGMPELDGIAAAKILTAKTPRPPVVLVTAFGDRATIQRAKAAGADRVLLKPIDIALLVQTVVALTEPLGKNTSEL